MLQFTFEAPVELIQFLLDDEILLVRYHFVPEFVLVSLDVPLLLVGCGGRLIL